jgi:hypothetical protein
MQKKVAKRSSTTLTFSILRREEEADEAHEASLLATLERVE